MEGTKLEISGQPNNDSRQAAATYKPIPEKDMEEEAVSRPKSLTKVKSGKETDGADEKMLPEEDKVINSAIVLSDVKISPNEKQNGDAKLDIGESRVFGGMDKEELMKYANDPFWVRLRWFLFITFWLLWAAMLVGAVLIIYAAPKCDPPPPRTWWQEGPLTEIQANTPPEDLKLIDNNVKGIIVNGFGDAYTNFDESHDVVKLIKQAKDLEKKVIIDLDPSASDEWYEVSENNQDSLGDFYIWRPALNSASVPPNNWLTMKDQSSWKYSAKRQEFYYAPFDKPHLNFRNENVTKKFSDVILKFLGYGAAGIRIRNAPFLLVDPEFKDELIAGGTAPVGSDLKQYKFYTHLRTENLPELGPLLKQWRAVVKNKTGDGPFMVKEELAKVDAYKVNTALMVDLPVQAQAFTKSNILVGEVINSLNQTFQMDNIEWPMWVVNTTALPTDVLSIVTNLLPGVPLVGPRDETNAQLLKIRTSPSVMRGICSIHSANNGTVFSFIRVTSGNPGVLVLLNTHDEKVTVNIPKQIPPLSLLTEVTVQLYSKNYNETDFMDVNAKKDAMAVPMSPKSAIVLSYVPKKRE